MQNLTIEQLRTANHAGGIANVMVKAQGGGFFVHITTRNGQAILTKARSNEPRCFTNPFQAITLLREVGITQGSYDVSQYDPDQKESTRTRPDRAEAMKRAHEAAAYDAWFRDQVQQAINDPNPSVQHTEAKALFDSRRKMLQKQISKKHGGKG